MEARTCTHTHWKQLIGTKVLKHGDTVSHVTEYDEHKEKYKAVNCIVIPSVGGDKHDGGKDDMPIWCKQLADTEGLRLRSNAIVRHGMCIR